MKFKIEEFISGKKSSIYTLKFFNETDTEIDKFIKRYKESYPEEIEVLMTRIERMAEISGCQDYLFKISEGKKSHNICALFVNDIRLYCLRYGNIALILGDGGIKDKGGAYQDYPRLLKIVNTLEEACRLIDDKIRNKEIIFSGSKLTGNLDFT